jgi:hypothetical protein
MQKLIVVACVLVLVAFGLHGQALTSLSGTVTDPSGAVIPGAKLTLINVDTGAQREDASDSQGRYTFAQVQPGHYRLQAKASGFNDITINDIRLLVSTPATVPVVFEKIGTVATTISVNDEAIQVNTTDASIGNAIGDKPITQLPFEARNVVGLLALQPGVTYIHEPDPAQQPDYRSGTVNGGKSDQANVTLDGMDVNDQQNRSPFNSVLRVTLDSVQEFRTITTNAGADFGRTSGAQVTLVTKSGTNALHGSLYEYLRNTDTSANDFFSNAAGVARAKLNRNVYGVSLGGPVKKDRLFFFLNWEARKDRSETLNSSIGQTRIVPTDNFRNGIFTYTRKDGTIGTLTPSQVKALDPLGIGEDPAVLSLLQQYPHANSSAAGDSLNTSGYIYNASTPLDWNTYVARFDYKLDNNGKHTLFWRGNLQNDRYANGLPQFPGQPNSSVFLSNNKGYVLGYTSILNASLISNFHYGYTRQGAENTGVQTTAASTFRDLSSLYPVGTNARGLARIIPVHQFSEDLSWVKGAHTVAFGGVIRLIRNSRANQRNSFSDAFGNSSYLNGSGGEFLAADAANTTVYKRQFSNLLGLLPQLDRQANYDLQGNLLPEGSVINRKFQDSEYEMYVQDTWKATSRLTITAGLRMSLFTPVSEAQGYQISAIPSLEDWFNMRGVLAGQGKPQSLAPLVQYDLASKTGRDLYPFQHDFAPRLSLAYSPKAESGLSKFLFGGPGRSSIRAGAGIYYDLFGQALITGFDSTALGFSSLLTNPANASSSTYPRFTGFYNVPFSSQFFPGAPAKSTFPQTYPDLFAITNSIDDKLKAPYTINLDFSIQRELGHGFMLQGAYIGRLSRRSLVKDDLAMPTNLVDPKSGVTYRQAAGQLTAMINQGVALGQVPKIPYFENLWPTAATSTLTATQNIYKLYQAQGGDYTTALLNLDDPSGDLCCSVLGPNAIFSSQYGSLAALRSLGSGHYHAMQWTLRKRFSAGFQFDFNYTYSKSIDLASIPENNQLTSGAPQSQINSTSIINSWFTNDMKAVSDYDEQHVFSAFWVAELPFGKGKKFAANANRLVDGIVGGWSLNGLFRNGSGFPVGVTAGGVWPTNWQVGSFAIQTGSVPAPTTTSNAPAPTASGKPGPNIFADPKTAMAAYSLPLAGDSGQRNGIRGDGPFSIDLGLGKRFNLYTIHDQQHSLQFRAEAFNLTNSVRFDPATVNLNILNPARFGQYTSTLTTPRVFQFSLRYEF